VFQMLGAGKRRLYIGGPILWVLSGGGNCKGQQDGKKAETNTHGNPPW